MIHEFEDVDIEKKLRETGINLEEIRKREVSVKHHLPISQVSDAGDILKYCIDDGTLKTSLENTLNNSNNAYLENPKLFPKTTIYGIGTTETKGETYRFGVIQQEYLIEAEFGTLDVYLAEGWDKEAIDIVLNKLEKLERAHTIERENLPKISTFEDFFKHEKKYNKRWNSPITNFCIKILKEKDFGFLEDLDIKGKHPKTLTKITREFAPRNVIVDGDKLTFDTELYGVGSIFTEHGVMVSQLLNKQNDFALQYLRHIEDRYGDEICQTVIFDLLGYRSGELIKELKGMESGRLDYHLLQFKEIVDLYKKI